MKQKTLSILITFKAILLGFMCQAQTYCGGYDSGSNGSCLYNGGILKVTFSELDNASACSGDNYSYADYTATSGLMSNVSLNKTYTIQVQMQEPSAGSGAAIWIDFNKNGTFESTEFYNLGTFTASGTVGTFTASIAIPATATPGTTRMRVRTRRGSALTAAHACGISGTHRGEVEDYRIKIIDNCAIPANISVSNNTDSSAKLTWDLSDSPHEYFISTDGTNAPTANTTPTGVIAKNYDTAALKNLAPGTPYHVWVRTACNSAAKSDWSSAVSFQTQSAAIPLSIFFKEIYVLNKDMDNSIYFSLASHSAMYSRFILQRSEDSKNFSTINSGTLLTQQELQTIADPHPLPGKNYYRIAIQGEDGTMYYSKVCKAATPDHKNVVSVYPNPVKGNSITLRADLDIDDLSGIGVYDMTGNKMKIRTEHLSGTSLRIDVADMAQGVYFLKYTCQGKQAISRIVKTK